MVPRPGGLSPRHDNISILRPSLLPLPNLRIYWRESGFIGSGDGVPRRVDHGCAFFNRSSF